MANRAVKRDISTLQNELFVMHGQIVIAGPYGAPGASITVNGLSGSLPSVLSGSSANQFTTTNPVARVANVSGSYILSLKDTWPRLLYANFQLAASGSQLADWTAHQDTGVALRSDTTGSSGCNQVGFTILNAATPAEPSGSVNIATINVALAFANSSV